MLIYYASRFPMAAKQTVRLSLDVSPELNDKLEELADKIHGSKSDVLRKAITLMQVAVEGKERGQRLGLANKDQPLATEIIGL
jgi:predicted transcriptional regulator